MITDNSPAIFGDFGKNSKECALDALKGINTSFSGYGIAEDEVIVFPTKEEVEKFGKKLFRKGKSTPNARNETAMCRCERHENGRTRQSWFNLGTLVRQANEADGTRKEIDDLHAEMRSYADASEVMEHLIGKAIVGSGTINAFGPKFDRQARQPIRNEDGSFQYEERTYVTIDWADVPGKNVDAEKVNKKK